MEERLLDSNDYSCLRNLDVNASELSARANRFLIAVNSVFAEFNFLGEKSLVIDVEQEARSPYLVKTPVGDGRITQSVVLARGVVTAEFVLWKRVFDSSDNRSWQKVFRFYLPLSGNPYLVVNGEVQSLEMSGEPGKTNRFNLGVTCLVRLMEG